MRHFLYLLSFVVGLGARGATRPVGPANARAVTVTTWPLANEEILEPSVQNEVDHALNAVSTNAVPLTAAARDFARLYETNGMSATQRAIALVSTQRGGCWHWKGTNVTPVAVRLLRQVSGRTRPQAK